MLEDAVDRALATRALKRRSKPKPLKMRKALGLDR